ncbi:MAG TPA: hypothetical protein VF615_04760 [Longimicrobiaceae bacterium]|jgi:hypothetical protein
MYRIHSLICAAGLAATLAACAESPTTSTMVPAAEPRAVVGPPGQLQWFGYAAGAEDDVSLTGTTSYANWGQVITDDNPSSTWATQRIAALSQHDMKAVVELGKLLWCGAPAYTNLCQDFATRWQTWKAANAGVLTSDKVLAFIIRDEPFTNGANPYSWQAAAAMVKQDFPWAKIMLIEAADIVACPHSWCAFNQYGSVITTVDWVGVDKYAIHPATDQVLQTAVWKMKQKYPGRKFIYVADGFWTSSHASAFLGASVGYMANIMREWYDVARADPDAVMLAVFIWNPFTGGISSRQFPPSVLYEHTQVGRAITGRARAQAHQPVGLLEGIGSDGYATGWACDPDGAWGEAVTVHMYMNGAYYNSGTADQPDVFRAQCRSGVSHRFRIPLGIGSSGQQMTAVAADLNAGTAQLPSSCAGSPACVWYYNP